MVYLVTGRIHSGKTTKMIELFQQHSAGDGFVALKTMSGNLVEKYDAMRLKTREILPLAVHEKRILPNFPVAFHIGPYHFRLDTVEKITAMMREMIHLRIQPLFLDELGELELSGSGYATIVIEMVASGLDLYLSVRDDLAERLVSRFDIGEHRIIPVN